MNEIRLVIFGAPGAGKGTQAKLLAKELGLLHLSTGDVLRAAIQNGTALGKKAQTYMDRGDLVPDLLVNEIVVSALEGLDKGGFILDGFPRTLNQAAELDAYLESVQRPITKVISLEVTPAELLRRILSRAELSVVKRSDDNESIVRSRLKAFEEQTMPLKRYYSDRKLLCEIDGVGSVAEIFESVKSAAIKQANC